MQLPDTTNWTVSQRIEWLRNCTPAQWDSICRRCGVCCLKKFDLSDVGMSGVIYTECACSHFDVATRTCHIYERRLITPNTHCAKVDLDVVTRGRLLPDSCAYVEFIYGPARVRPDIDWANVHNTPDTPTADRHAIRHIISGSHLWTRNR